MSKPSPTNPVFVPRSCYVSALKLAQELARELRDKCPCVLHRDQIEKIDDALLEVGEGRDVIEALVDRLKIEELKGAGFYCWRLSSWGREYVRETIEVTKREFDAVELGVKRTARGVVAEVTMKTSEVSGRYCLRFDFTEAKQ